MPTQTKVGWRSAVAPATSYLLDTYSGAAAAYSLRKLRTAYTGNAIRVRRSSDNTSQDIGFDANGELDTASMLSFVGSNNQALYSEEFDNANWNKYITTVTSNQTTAPDGTMTADLLAENTANNYHTLYNAITLSFAVGTSWNVSLYVKKGPGTSAPNTIILGFPSATSNTFTQPCVLFDISSGAVLDSSNVSNDANFGSSIVDAGNGWWRCSVWGTVTVTSNRLQFGVIRFNNNLNTLNTSLYVGNAQANIYIWGYQFQKALNNTSVLTTQPYTKTTATTNAGDGFVSIWYDQSSTYNALQATSANQPQIVSSGTLITMNGKPTVKFDGSNDFLVTSNYSFTSTDKVYVAHVSSIATTTASSMVVGHYRQFNPSIFLVGYTSNTRGWVVARNTANTTALEYAFGTYSINTQYLYETQYDLLNATSTLRIKNYRNNSAETMFTNGGANNALPTLSQPISIGSTDNGGHFRLNGNIQEIVLYYNQDQSTNRAPIASNINSFYSIY
jgi:hypothetical protein